MGNEDTPMDSVKILPRSIVRNTDFLPVHKSEKSVSVSASLPKAGKKSTSQGKIAGSKSTCRSRTNQK